MRLIDADNFIEQMRALYAQEGWKDRDIHFSLADLECNIEMMPTICDAELVERAVYEQSEKAGQILDTQYRILGEISELRERMAGR